MAIRRNLFTNDVYIIDMSSLKELHDRYPKSLFPTIWQHITSLIQNEQLHSHIEALREIRNTMNPKDKLLLWSIRNKNIFSGMDDCQIDTLSQIKSKFNQGYWNNNMNRPAPWADPYLIAMAICEKGIIITQEHKTKANRIPPRSNWGLIH
ncbi:MAG: DUF4411 family protein [Bacteroidetes bacterium]|nr:DUF4411 family protein [Bacteroidota bacterium]